MNTITLTKTQKKLSPKRLLQYGILIGVAYFAFRMFDTLTKNKQQQQGGVFYDDDTDVELPENGNDFDTGNEQFQFDKNVDVNMDVNIAGKEPPKKEKSKGKAKMLADNVDELDKMIEEEEKKEKEKQKEVVRKKPNPDPEEEEDLKELKDEAIEDFDRKHPAKNRPFHKGEHFDTGDDSPEIAKEKHKRRIEFFKKIKELNKEFDEDNESEMHESVELLYFVSAAWTKTFKDVVNLVVSIQNHYPTASIVIYDIGMDSDQKNWLKTVCQVQVKPSFIEVWPPHIRDLENKLWRPIILQMALAHMSHLIWIEPYLVINRQKMNAYIQHSRKFGILFAGQRQKYSTYIVTHPDMYYYLSSDTRKLQRVPHFEINMILLHNTNTIQQRFMKWLVACTIEEWCIAPIGSKRSCDTPNLSSAKYYANCHRYDESAMNILLKSWMKYDLDKFSLRDVVTNRNDGRDAKVRARVCSNARKAGDL
ncbi:hypothetical protein LOTGIDRAFT_168942 [Lottia gigantea]|uniref:Uncharacterized protein n=1 Tax=Lottia gigantea TaxID=225164 RepID=V3ZSP3_LOTGI|nr:hypothetical protein LOTGIDRAFT_168942 [Lottia gigantea]ESO83901.1 hypothetical protein LOTGIDRAFT_168942 [Lottia gigantea]